MKKSTLIVLMLSFLCGSQVVAMTAKIPLPENRHAQDNTAQSDLDAVNKERDAVKKSTSHSSSDSSYRDKTVVKKQNNPQE